jgi:acyl dehydratase
MINPTCFEDYRPGETRTTTGRTITEADIVIHAGHTGDFYPHHMDAEWVKRPNPSASAWPTGRWSSPSPWA